MGLVKINHTQISNDFIDNWMNKLTPTASLIFIAISRKTIGWHKDTDRISYSQLIDLTGIKSHNTLKKSIEELINNNLITVNREGTGKNIKTYYEIDYMSNFNMSKNDIKDDNNMSKNDIKQTNNMSNFDTTKDININKEYKENSKSDDLPCGYKSYTDTYSEFLIQEFNIDQQTVNDNIFKVEKERKNLSNLIRRFKRIEDFKVFLQQSKQVDFVKKNKYLPSILLNQFSNINLQPKSKYNDKDFEVIYDIK